ncbi:MAG TPA: ABC transporter ATP-binding protein [Actinobacteria bacterium]|nr:ABC transporter ATP-binding protein [Actinomycetota bacterium]
MSARTPACTRTPIIVGEDIEVRYHKRTVLEVERFELCNGETHAILGPSGSGKSTLLRILGLLEKPAHGHVTLDGRPVEPGDKSARMMMAAVFQNPYLFKGTVGENVAYGLALRKVPREQRDERVAAALERVGLGGTQKSSALQLSGGEAQRVALARALVLEPRIMLLDEPLSYLDPLIKRRLVTDFSEILSAEGVTALYVTHDQDEAMVVADRVTIINEGRVVRSGGVDEVMTLPTTEWVADFIGMETALHGGIVGRSEGVAEVSVGGERVFAVTDLPVGIDVLVGIRPEDVLLFDADVDIPQSSARNRLRMRVDGVERRGGTDRISLSSNGFRIAASVSRASAREMGLEPGSEVVALFKATSVTVASAVGVPSGV